MTDPVAIGLEKVSLGYSGSLLMEDLDLKIGSGEFIGIIGPNGCGKTTLLKLICATLSPQSGGVRLYGQAIGALSRKEIAKQIAIVPQEINALLPYTVREMVAMGRRPHHDRFTSLGRKDAAVVDSAMSEVGLSSLADRFFPELSGGEKQKVSLAQALAQETNIVLLDEPTTHLDIAHQLEIMKLAAKLNSERKKTVIAVLHDLNLAAKFCRRLVLMKQGKIFASGPPKAVLNTDNLRKLFACEVVVDRHPTTGELSVSYAT